LISGVVGVVGPATRLRAALAYSRRNGAGHVEVRFGEAQRAPEEITMKKGMLFGLMAVAVGCAGVGGPARAGGASPASWRGFMLRNGVQVPIAVELARASADWTGQLRVGNSSLPMEQVRVTGLGVHFELPGEGVFDGTVAGNRMAGSVSSSSAQGSFALTRDVDEAFADPITSSGP